MSEPDLVVGASGVGRRTIRGAAVDGSAIEGGAMEGDSLGGIEQRTIRVVDEIGEGLEDRFGAEA